MYLRWLEKWLTAGNQPTHYYDYPATRWNWLVAQEGFRTGDECGANAVNIIVPSGIRWLGGGRGHNKLYFMDGPSHQGGVVPVFEEPEFYALGAQVIDFIKAQKEKDRAFRRAMHAPRVDPRSDVPRRRELTFEIPGLSGEEGS